MIYGAIREEEVRQNEGERKGRVSLERLKEEMKKFLRKDVEMLCESKKYTKEVKFLGLETE